MSTKKEQEALVAFFNSFELRKPLASFKQLSDGKVFMEVMSKVDATHFKNTPGRETSSNDNWVLYMNTLKRLYRLLLSLPLPSPHPASLSLSTLPEPPFRTIARSPSSPEAIAGLLQIARMCLSVSVWAPGNEKVIARIQGLEEGHMAELMRGIEEIMRTLPAREESEGGPSSPGKVSRRSPSPVPTSLRSERDKLIQENDELRQRCENLISQIAEISTDLDEATAERDDAVARFQRETSGSLRTSLNATGEAESLRNDLARAEENLAHTEAELEKQLSTVKLLTKQVEDYKIKAEQAAKLKDQLDEYRHAADKLQKSENVIEKYKKKLEDSAGLRRELRALEEENAVLVDTNAKLEAELNKAGSSKALIDELKRLIENLEERSKEQNEQIAQLNVQLENAQAEIVDRAKAHEQDREELELHQEKMKEMELGSSSHIQRSVSDNSLADHPGDISLGDELGTSEEIGLGSETKTALKIRIRALQKEISDLKTKERDTHQVSALENLLADANKSRDRYQTEYLEARRDILRLQTNLEQGPSAKGSENSAATAALRQRLNEVIEERDRLLLAQEELTVTREQIEKQLEAAKVDLSLVRKDQIEQIAILRQKSDRETKELDGKANRLREEITVLRDKDKSHLEELRGLLLDKVDLQSTGILQRERELERERNVNDIRAQLSRNGVDQDTQNQLLEVHSKNMSLANEIDALRQQLQKAKNFIKDQDALFRAEYSQKGAGNFDEAQKSYEAQISSLKAEVLKAKQATSSLEHRYKLEQQVMLSAWHELGARTVRDHIAAAGQRRPIQRPVATSWLGRQRRQQEEASFSR
ncbi:protein-nucleus import-related protein [Papiliotrema laurentii]|uniref:Protein-nucleus import-related protein n=1 Tax=Papiliotrema laurentii TaxID=5418 RepID=A0AAD9FW22_PAPLA|nr:protein-nucleus import-related protein [Papiliotrema laurentii]